MGREKLEILGFGFEKKVEERAQGFGVAGKRPYGHFRLASFWDVNGFITEDLKVVLSVVQ